MDDEVHEIRVEYEEEVEVRTELRVETRNSTGCPLHGHRWYRRQRTARHSRQQAAPQRRAQGQGHCQNQQGPRNGK